LRLGDLLDGRGPWVRSFHGEGRAQRRGHVLRVDLPARHHVQREVPEFPILDCRSRLPCLAKNLPRFGTAFDPLIRGRTRREQKAAANKNHNLQYAKH
jgi:hypothetical protein